jgi:hypothetical protein
MTNLALADPAWRLVSESAPTEVPPSGKKVTDQFVAELEKGKKGGRREKGSEKGSVLDIVYSPPSFFRRYTRWFR